MNPFDPMPTIKAILGMTMAQDIEQSIMLAELDNFEAPQCESKLHNGESDHHFGEGSFLIVTSCGCPTFYACALYTSWLLGREYIRCRRCDARAVPSDLTILPIGGKS